MVEGYDSADANQIIPPELDDYICDYVDGSMDPAVRCSFEEFLQANPHVESHVHSMAETARLLRAHGRCLCAPDGFDNRLRCAVRDERLDRESTFSLDAIGRLGGVVVSGSTIAIVCLSMLLLSYDLNEQDDLAARADFMELFGEEAEALGGGATLASQASFNKSAPDRGALDRSFAGPYTPAFMRHIVLDQSPVPVFQSVKSSPVLVLYP